MTGHTVERAHQRLPTSSAPIAVASIGKTSGGLCGLPAGDGHAGLEALYDRPVSDQDRPDNAAFTEVACWAHCCRKFCDVWDSKKSSVAKEAIDRIAVFYPIEDKARFAPAAERLMQGTETAPHLAAVFKWAGKVVTKLSAKSELAEAFRYTLKQRDPFHH